MSRESEITRRAFNVWESLIVAGLLALFGLIFSTRETVVRLTEQVAATNERLDTLTSNLADVPELRTRVTANEGEIRRLRADVDRMQAKGAK